MHESESEVAQSFLTLSDPMECSLLGSSVHGIFQARVLEWGAIAFSILYVTPVQINNTNNNGITAPEECPVLKVALKLPGKATL